MLLWETARAKPSFLRRPPIAEPLRLSTQANQRFQRGCKVLKTTTPFDTNEHHILINVLIDTGHEIRWRIKAILDTGAPWTEISDEFLRNAGIPGSVPRNIPIPEGLQTQRFGKLALPELSICGQTLWNIEVKVARFEQSWGVDALVGLDFFRHFPVTIDYKRGVLEVG